jgi:Carboxypeptidase regulatory-like domain
METKPSRGRLRQGLALLAVHGLLAAAWTSGAVTPAHAQDSTLQVLFSDNADGTDAKPDLLLRPNVTLGFFVVVENTGKAQRTVSVQLLSGRPAQEVGKSEAVTVPPDSRKVVSFGKPAPLSPGAQAPPWPEIQGPPFRFQAAILEKAKPVRMQTVTVGLVPPKQYADASAVWDAPRNELAVEVKTKPGFFGPPAKVSLNIPEALNPLLDTRRVTGAASAMLRPRESAVLVARGFVFRDRPRENGLVYVNVDAYDRAFAFETTFDPQGGVAIPQPLPSRTPRIRVAAAHYTKPVTNFAVTLEVDNAPRSDVTMELGLDRSGSKRFETQPFTGDRNQHVHVNPQTAEGTVQFKTDVHDHQTVLDLTNILGRVTLRGRMLDSEGKVIAIQGRQPGQLGDEVLTDVIVDDTPPENPQFVKPSLRVLRGDSLIVRALAEDPESGIKEVNFFLDKPTAEKKVPPNIEVTKARAPTPKEEFWSATIPMPIDAKVVPVTAQFVNNVGLDTFKTILITVVDPAANAPVAAKTGTIKGVVKDAGDRAQPNLTVILSDDKGMRKDAAKTDANGEFVFNDVLPGIYIVGCRDDAAMSAGQTPPLTVEAGKTTEAGVKMALR